MAKENKENYLYFSAGAKSGAGSRMVPQGGGAGPRSSGDAACWPCSELLGVEPGSVTTTFISFEGSTNKQDGGDTVEITHDNTSASTGHRSRIISQAIAEACNANPHNPQMVVVFDAFTQTYFGGMSDLVDDASYACAITVDS